LVNFYQTTRCYNPEDSNLHRCKVNGEQSSFTKGRSTADQIFTIRQILEKCNMQQEVISLIFYYLEKAYDSVPRKLLWQALGKANVSQSVIQIIRNIPIQQ
jgi:hypothetical protein